MKIEYEMDQALYKLCLGTDALFWGGNPLGWRTPAERADSYGSRWAGWGRVRKVTWVIA